jgi:hypothetical protein
MTLHSHVVISLYISIYICKTRRHGITESDIYFYAKIILNTIDALFFKALTTAEAL